MLERKMKPHQGNSPLHILGRYALYTVLIIAVFLPLPVVVTASGIGAYGEGGFIEWCPFILLATSLSIFLIGFYLQPEERGAFALLAVLVCLALVRKNDACLDSMISIGGWKTLAALVATVGFLVVFHERSSIRQGTVHNYIRALVPPPMVRVRGRCALLTDHGESEVNQGTSRDRVSSQL